MRFFLLTLFAVPLIAQAQPRVGAALKFGVPFQGWFAGVGGREYSVDRSRPWTLGLSAEARFADAISLEASGFYQRLGQDSAGGYIHFSDRERGYGWEFPIVAKLRLPARLAGFRPFVEAGPSIHWLRTHTDSDRYGGNLGGPYTYSRTSSRTSDWTAGLTLGAGVEKVIGRLRLSVEARYTRWPTDSPYENLRRREPNQGVIQFGAGF
jgi:opacity protein-like surface antigen